MAYVHGGIVCQGPCGEARGQLCQVSCLLLLFRVWRCMWGFRLVLQEPYLLSHLALTGCFYHRREWQLTCHSSVCSGHSALASVTSNPEGTAHWCTWQLSQGVKSYIFNSGCSSAWELFPFGRLADSSSDHGESKIPVSVGSLLVRHDHNVRSRHNSVHIRRGKLSLFKERKPDTN